MTHELDVGQADLLLTTTRAVRKRLDLTRDVEPSVVLDCVRVASQAPSGGNGQRWRWVIVRDAARRRLVADRYAEAYAEYIEPRKAGIRPDDAASRRMIASSDHLAENLAQVPLLVIPTILDRVAPDASPRELASFYGGIFPAVWSLQLALRSRGLGSSLTTLHLDFEREIGAALGIPETATQVALLPVAYFTGEGFRPAHRRPVEELTFWDEWKVTMPSPSGEGT